MIIQRNYKRDKRSPIPEKETTSRVMSAIKSRNTKPELLVRKYLTLCGHGGYRLNCKKVPGKPDICFIGRKVAIFIHGCYWHRCPYCKLPVPKSHSNYWVNKFKKNKIRDNKNLKLLIKDGWAVFILWECQIKKDLESEAKKLIVSLDKNSFLKSPKSSPKS